MERISAEKLPIFIKKVLNDSTYSSESVNLIFMNTETLHSCKKIFLRGLSISYINSLDKINFLHFASHRHVTQFVKEKISTYRGNCAVYGFCDLDTACYGLSVSGRVLLYLLGRLAQLENVKIHIKGSSEVTQTSERTSSDTANYWLRYT